MQDVVVAFCTSVVAPCIYQALLHVAICIASPFNRAEAKIPTKELLDSLQRDLIDGEEVARRCPCWEPPSYQVAP